MKLKTRRGAAKRFKKTGNGIKRKQAFKRHISVSYTHLTLPTKRIV